MITRDLLWKGIIEDLFEDFLGYFFPELYPLVDLEKGYEFLDKELQQIYPASALGQRFADKLAKVYLKSGGELWLLVHIEIQGYTDQDFARRMFSMFYRLLDRYNVNVCQLAIFTDDSPHFFPTSFHYEKFGTWLNYGYRAWKLLDNPPDILSKSNNIFALVMEAAWGSMPLFKNDEALYQLKTSLIRKLLTRDVGKATIRKLFQFIEHYAHFEKTELAINFENEINQISRPMGIEELIKERMLLDAEEKGIAKGIEQGIEQGIEKNTIQVIELMLQKGFEPAAIVEILEVELSLVLRVKEGLRNRSGN